MYKINTRWLVVAVSTTLSLAATTAAASPWTYRGSLSDGGQPANGTYDLRVTLLNQAKTASVASPVTLYQVAVKDGAFAVEIDFGIELANAPVMRLKTEVAQGGSGFVQLGEPAYFDAKSALGSAVCWNTEGNAGTDGLIDFLGTTDDQPLQLRTNGVRNLGLYPSPILFDFRSITSTVIAGSRVNAAPAGGLVARGATIAGGGMPAGDSDPDLTEEGPNLVFDVYGTVSGGYNNRAGDGNADFLSAAYASVGGGRGNRAFSTGSTVGGGDGNVASGIESTIAGGVGNIANGFRGSIGGGANNRAVGFATVAGGLDNFAGANRSTVAGGSANLAGGEDSNVGGGSENMASGTRAAVGGGFGNTASNLSSTVAGGLENIASGIGSGVSGGADNCAGGDHSWAGGSRAKIRPGNQPSDGDCVADSADTNGDQGTFLWAGDLNSDFRSTGSNQFGVRASGGVFFGDFLATSVSIPAGRFINTSSGAHLTTGGAWTNASSRSLKTNFEAIDPIGVLAKVANLPLAMWAYKNSVEGRHLGPTAEDFQSAFGLGGDGKSISTVDADGVALAAIQGLNQKLETENTALKHKLTLIEAQNALFAQRLDALERSR